jgi:hypothetical protein
VKKALLAVVVLMFLPRIYATACTVSVTPPSFTLQTNHTQVFSATTQSCTPGGTIAWSLSCTPLGSCSTGKLSSKTTNPTTYTAPGSASGSAATPWVAQVTATYSLGGASSASVTITAVQINSLLIPPPQPTGSVAAWQTYVLANSYPSNLVGGINPLLDWATIDTNGGNTTTINGNLSSFDTSIAANFPNSIPTKKINLIVQGVTGGAAIGGGAPNSSTPAYVLSSLGSGNVFNGCGYGQATNPATGLPGGFPAVWLQAYFQPYQAFIQAVLSHYSSSANSILANYIGYIRFGLSAGGEVYPFCDPGVASDNTWSGYAGAMDLWLHQQNPSIQLMTSINKDDAESNYTLPDAEATDAWTYSIGFGSQGLQQNDYVQGQTCTSDWCNQFANYYNRAPLVPLELQTVLLSDPIPNDPIVKGTPSQTGSLSHLIPFALPNHTEIFEIYPFDLLYALDSSYCTVSGSTQKYCTTQNHQGNRSYPSCYQNTLENAANGVTPNPQQDCVLNQ